MRTNFTFLEVQHKVNLNPSKTAVDVSFGDIMRNYPIIF